MASLPFSIIADASEGSLTVPVVMVHFRQHVHGVGIESQVGIFYDSESIKLMSKCSLSENELGGIGPVEAIHAIRATYPILKGDRVPPRYVIVAVISGKKWKGKFV